MIDTTGTAESEEQSMYVVVVVVVVGTVHDVCPHAHAHIILSRTLEATITTAIAVVHTNIQQTQY